MATDASVFSVSYGLESIRRREKAGNSSERKLSLAWVHRSELLGADSNSQSPECPRFGAKFWPTFAPDPGQLTPCGIASYSKSRPSERGHTSQEVSTRVSCVRASACRRMTNARGHATASRSRASPSPPSARGTNASRSFSCAASLTTAGTFSNTLGTVLGLWAVDQGVAWEGPEACRACGAAMDRSAADVNRRHRRSSPGMGRVGQCRPNLGRCRPLLVRTRPKARRFRPELAGA